MIVTVFTNDNHLWLLQGFAYLLNRFWGKTQKVMVVGFNPPTFDLPRNFEFHSLGTDNLPVGEWSTGLIRYLYVCPEELILLMLEDYWLYRPVNVKLINRLWQRFSDIEKENTILRIDLTNDRAVRKQKRPYENLFGFDLISTPPHTPYQMSYQAAIWNVEALLDFLKPDEDPWTSEVQGTQRLKERDDLLVLGTNNRPLIYQPVYRSHRRALQIDKIPQPILSDLEEQGCLL